MQRILIIEDEISISDLISLNLTIAGFSTQQAFDRMQGIQAYKENGADLVLLDIMLPVEDGYELLSFFKKKGVPVIFLTAKNSLRDKINGLDAGADDYITKPFEAVELIARIKAVLRRIEKEKDIRKISDVELHIDKRKVYKSGDEVELTTKEFDLLECFMVNQGIAMSRDKLLEKVWTYDYPGGTRTVDMHVQKLRSKLDTLRIETVYKLGYRLEV